MTDDTITRYWPQGLATWGRGFLAASRRAGEQGGDPMHDYPAARDWLDLRMVYVNAGITGLRADFPGCHFAH